MKPGRNASADHMMGCRMENLNRVPGPEWDNFFDSSLHLGWVLVTTCQIAFLQERKVGRKLFKNNRVEKELAVILPFIFQERKMKKLQFSRQH